MPDQGSDQGHHVETSKQQHQYTIYKEGGPGFTRYIVYADQPRYKCNFTDKSSSKVDDSSRQLPSEPRPPQSETSHLKATENKTSERRGSTIMKRHKSLPPQARRKTRAVSFVNGKSISANFFF